MWSPLDALRARRAPLGDDDLWALAVAHCLIPAEVRRLRYQRVVLTNPQYEPERDRLDQEAGQLELGGIGYAGVQALGTMRPDGAWHWAWDDDSLHPRMREYADDLRRHARRGRLGDRFTRPVVSDVGILDVAALGVVTLEADGHHLVRQADGSDLVLLVRHPNLAREPLAYDRLPAIVARLLSTRAMPHPVLLEGWRANESGLRFEDREDGALVAEAVALEGFRVGTRWIVERDDDGDILRVGEQTPDGRTTRASPLRVIRDVPEDGAPRPDDPAAGWRAVVSRSAIQAMLQQARFEAGVLRAPGRSPSSGWDLNVYEARLDFAGVGSFEVQALGTELGHGPWLWAWADTSLPADLTQASSDLRDEAAESPWTTPITHPATDLVSAVDVGLVGVRNVGADAFYVAPRPDGGTLVLLVWHERLAWERLPYEELPHLVAHLVATHDLDHRALLAGWRAGEPAGLRFVDEPDGGLTVVAEGLPPGPDGTPDPAEGDEWRFELDDVGRIVSVRGTVGGGETPPGPAGPGAEGEMPRYPWDERRGGGGAPGAAMPGGAAWQRSVSRCAMAAAVNQARFAIEVLQHPDRDPSGGARYDVDAGQLVFDGVGTFRAEVLATVDDATGTVSWSSTDPSLPEHVKGLTAELRAPSLTSPYRTPLADDTTTTAGVLESALVGLWHCGVDAYYVDRVDETRSRILLLWHPNLSARRLPYELWPSTLMRLISDLPLDHGLLIDGWRSLEPAGLRFVDEPDGTLTVVADGVPADEEGRPDPVEGAVWRVAFDASGRVAGVDSVVRPPGFGPA